MKLDIFVRDVGLALIKRMEKAERKRQQDIAEFKVIDLARAVFDKDYQRQLDERFGEGWERRTISYDWPKG